MSVIKLLLDKERSVACWRDTQKLTPLLRAAMLSPPYLPAIEAIVQHCPESVEVCDGSGRTLLHLMNKLPSSLDYKQLFKSSPEVEALKNCTDKEGNTPTHIALLNQNIDMFLILLKSKVNITIRNKDGVCAADLIQQQSDDFWQLFRERLTKLTMHKVDAETFDDEMDTIFEYEEQYIELVEREVGPTLSSDESEAVRTVNLTFLKERIDKVGNPCFFLRKFNNSGFLDLINWREYKNFNEDQKEFIRLAIKTSPSLMYQIGSISRTPLHSIAKFAPDMVDKPFLDKLTQGFKKIQAETSSIEELCYDPPWIVKDHIVGFTPLYMAILSKNIKCAKTMLEFNPELAIQVNVDYETPLHLLSKSFSVPDDLVPADMMDDVKVIVWKSDAAVKMKDGEGYIPLLRAAKEKNLQLVDLIFKMDPYWHLHELREPNGNTIWHLLADMKIISEERRAIIDNILLDRKLNPYIFQNLKNCNIDNDTPLHLAIKDDNFQLAYIFFPLLLEKCQIYDKSSFNFVLSKCNKDGKTPLHLLVGRSKEPFAKKFIINALDKSDNLEGVLGVFDNEGNTPLHQAILKEDFNLVEMFIESALLSRPRKLDTIMNIPNSKGETPNDLIGSAQYLTPEFEEFLRSNHLIVKAMVGVRSLTGVSTEMIKDYTNTLGVISALLATVTFTAAFTVPGGLNSNNGTPLLMKKAAFQVFMISDILAMCLSMMVLFCLLWIMTVDTKKKQVMLLDFTVILLEAAFYATLSTFMTGLYVTVSPITHWIAILTCVLCSLLILLMHKRFITRLIPYLIRIYADFRKVYLPYKKLCGCIQHSSRTSYKKSCGSIQQCCRTNHRKNEEGSTNFSQANEQEETTVEITSVDVNQGVSNP